MARMRRRPGSPGSSTLAPTRIAPRGPASRPMPEHAGARAAASAAPAHPAHPFDRSADLAKSKVASVPIKAQEKLLAEYQ